MIVCNSCGLIDQYTTEQKSNNLVATCTCGAYIKNLPQDKPKFYFGKYNGKAVDEVDDLGYLEWYLRDIKKITSRMRAAIETQIKILKVLMK